MFLIVWKLIRSFALALAIVGLVTFITEGVLPYSSIFVIVGIIAAGISHYFIKQNKNASG
ncbi:hypothetical protein [Virgibacillus sediminis]|uniref:Uncharacterized protein n=1 Tax=Virgibacillus sediminis TaxID=202260 RepID=A0ABV7A1B6_9BACI